MQVMHFFFPLSLLNLQEVAMDERNHPPLGLFLPTHIVTRANGTNLQAF
jgi:hypothetical protein